MKTKKNKIALNMIFLTGFILLATLFTINQPLPVKFSILITACFIYLIWAYLYHHLDKSLNTMIILEYVLFATLVIILLAGFLT